MNRLWQHVMDTCWFSHYHIVTDLVCASEINSLVGNVILNLKPQSIQRVIFRLLYSSQGMDFEPVSVDVREEYVTRGTFKVTSVAAFSLYTRIEYNYLSVNI